MSEYDALDFAGNFYLKLVKIDAKNANQLLIGKLKF